MQNGWIIINKPLEISSAHVVNKVKRIIGRNNKLGHAGTLDPLASGVLPLAVGEATKLVQYLIDSSKVYEFEVTWGEERSTDDAEGEVTNRAEPGVWKMDIKTAIAELTGEIDQVPPIYSALKVNGQRAYDLARAGKEVELKSRRVTIHSLELLTPDAEMKESASFRMYCSKGTYVRSIARDLGRKLGCLGYVTRLHRAAHGQFGEECAISLEKFEELWQKGDVSACMLPVEEVLDGIPALPLDEEQEAKIRHGIAIDNIANFDSETNIALMKNEKIVAIAAPVGNKLQPKRVFNH